MSKFAITSLLTFCSVLSLAMLGAVGVPLESGLKPYREPAAHKQIKCPDPAVAIPKAVGPFRQSECGATRRFRARQLEAFQLENDGHSFGHPLRLR